jgi:hypothetical protein
MCEVLKHPTVSSGHSTHHQGHKKLIWWKRVLRFVFKEEDWRVIVKGERKEMNKILEIVVEIRYSLKY